MSRTDPIRELRNGQCRDGTVDGGGDASERAALMLMYRDNTPAYHWQRVLDDGRYGIRAGQKEQRK